MKLTTISTSLAMLALQVVLSLILIEMVPMLPLKPEYRGLAQAAAVAADKHNDRNDRYDDNYNHYNNNYGNNYGYGGNPRSTVRCESKDNRFKYCNLPFRGHVEVYKQQSSDPCIHGRSWGTEGNRMWVNNGCRADFAVY